MEASGMGQGTGGDGGQQGDQQGGEGQGLDLAALQGQLTQHGESLESMREFMQELRQAQPQQPDPQQQPDLELDLSYLDPEVAASMDPQQLQQMLGQTIQQQAEAVAQRMLDQRLNPLQDQIAEQQRSADVGALIGEFPELGEDETAEQMLKAAGHLAQQIAPGIAQAMGMPGETERIAQALANSPAHWRSTYLAGRAVDAAQEEQGDVPSPVSLESGAGATPGGGGGDLGDQIVGAHRGASVLPF
jgi:hypothetical protein